MSKRNENRAGYKKTKVGWIPESWDKAIEQTEKIIEAKQELKKGLMQKLLTGEIRVKTDSEVNYD